MTRPIQPPSAPAIIEIAEAALAEMPGPFRAHLQGLAVLVEEFPDDETCTEMELESPFDLLGLYSGVAMSEGEAAPGEINRIFLYRRPILDYWCETGEDLAHVVRHVLIHEIGHHFGLSDEDMDRIEQAADQAQE